MKNTITTLLVAAFMVPSLSLLAQTETRPAKPDSQSAKFQAQRAQRRKAAEPDRPQRVKRLEAALAQAEKDGFCGVVLAARNGDVLLRKGAGLADPDTRRANTPETLYDIGSVAKPFTASAVLKLAMQKKLKLDDPISRWFKDTPKDKAAITVEQLLSHTSGVARTYDFDHVDTRRRDAVVKHLLAIPLASEPGSRHEYSNANYFLAAAIVEIAGGQRFESCLEKNLFAPAGMTSTGFCGDKDLPARRAAMRLEDGRNLGPMPAYAWSWSFRGATGMITTVDDLLKFSDALLTDAVLDAPSRSRQRSVVKDSYACGWYVLKTSRNTTLLTHGGASAGARALFHRFVDEDAVIIVLCNKPLPKRHVEYEVAKALEAALLGSEQ